MNLNNKKIIIIIFNVPNKKTKKLISKNLLKKKLVSCININKVKSYYYWNNKIKKKKEIKIITKSFLHLEKKIKKIIYKFHTYEIPEILTLDILKINKKYLNWMIKNII